MNKLHRIVAVLVVVVAAAPALAQADAAVQAQRKLLSQRAAQADAYRKLAETVKGLQINSETYVRDFVAESDVIQSELDTFIKGVRLGRAKCYEDLSCEVPAEVTVVKVVTTLKEIHTRHYKGDSIKGTDIEQMNKKIAKKIIKVVGMGALREDLPPGLPAGVEDVILKGPPLSPSPPIPPFWANIPVRARLMAGRAAELDALRKLTERIRGIRITSDTLVRDFVAESDTIQTVTKGTLVGYRETRRYLHHDEPIVEVTIEIPLESVITTIKELHSRSIQGDSVKGSDITELTQRIKRKTFEATGMGVIKPEYLVKVEAVTQVKPDWAKNVIKMEGQGVPAADKAGTAQGKLMAARAAELDAKRRLGEHIYGLQIDSSTLVRDFVTEHDEISSHMDAVLVGSSVDSTRFDGETATVVVSIPGMQVWEIVSERIRVTRIGG